MVQINYPLNNHSDNFIKKNKNKTEKPQVQIPDNELLKKRTEVGLGVLSELVEERVPEQGRFRTPVSICFDIPSTNNQAFISVEESAKNREENRDISLGVKHKERDRMTSYYILMNKPKKEILEYINNRDNQSYIIENILKLSQSTDEFYSSL